jgi:hypothetical protein
VTGFEARETQTQKYRLKVEGDVAQGTAKEREFRFIPFYFFMSQALWDVMTLLQIPEEARE